MSLVIQSMKGQISSSLRFSLLLPVAMLVASVISCCVSYSRAEQILTDDLNEAVLALVNEKKELWVRNDTIAALRQLIETTQQPLIYKATDIQFRNTVLKEQAFFTLSLVDKKNGTHKLQEAKIASDSILLVPECTADGLAVQVRGFADCSFSSLFSTADKTFPGTFFALFIMSSTGMLIWRGKESKAIKLTPDTDTLDNIRLTPMQKQLVRMLLQAPGMRVDKATICTALWGNKSNAEESLYTLVRRTKTALATSDLEIVCNRGDSYELHINR